MDGEISLDTETRSLRGFQLVVGALLLWIGFLVFLVARSLLGSLPVLMTALVTPTIIVLFFVLISGKYLGFSPSRVLSGTARLAGRAATKSAGAVAHGATGGIRAGARVNSSSSRLTTSVTVRRFRVRAMTGGLVSCVQLGELIGDEVRHGDYVLLDGRRTRDGHFLLHRVDVLQTPNGPTLSVVRTRQGVTHNAKLLADRVCLVAGFALVAALIVEAIRTVR